MLKNLIAALIILSVISSCADKEDTYNKKKAVSVFAIIDTVKVDPKLKKRKITLPKQKSNKFWNGSINSQNNRVENFAKDFSMHKRFFEDKAKIDLKKTAQIWHSFSYTRDDDYVFSPVIIDDKAFFLDDSGVLLAYNIKTEKKIWKKRVFARKYLTNYQNPKISYAKGKIFAIAGINKIAAVKAADGQLLWSKTISSVPISTPICDGKRVYVTTNDNKLYAFDATKGDLLWAMSGIMRSTAILGAADPVFHKDNVIAAFSSGEIYAVNKKTGQVQWSQDLNIAKANSSDFYLNDIDATPLVKNDVIYTIGNGGLMMAINAKTGNYLWKREIAGVVDFWMAGDFLYVINNDNRLLAVYKKTGGIKWISQLPNLKKETKPHTKRIYNGVVMAGNELIISDNEGNILVASPFNGKVKSKFESGERFYHAPIIVNGKIYLHRLGFLTIDLLEIH